MTDYALKISDKGFYFDLSFDQDKADFDLDEGLENSVIMSLFMDARAEVEQLPFPETNQRGYWGDVWTEIEGHVTGSLIWLLMRETLTNDVAKRAEDYARASLKWMVTDNIAEKITVTTTIHDRETLRLTVVISRPQGDETYRYDALWQAQKIKRVE